MKEDLTKPTNNAIEELMKILEEENAKLKEFELPKAEKAVKDAHNNHQEMLENNDNSADDNSDK